MYVPLRSLYHLNVLSLFVRTLVNVQNVRCFPWNLVQCICSETDNIVVSVGYVFTELKENIHQDVYFI